MLKGQVGTARSDCVEGHGEDLMWCNKLTGVSAGKAPVEDLDLLLDLSRGEVATASMSSGAHVSDGMPIHLYQSVHQVCCALPHDHISAAC